MTQPPDLAALACEDCPAVLRMSRGAGVAGPVMVVAVEHEPSCPWLARVAPSGATMSGPHGVLLHFRRAADTAVELGQGVDGDA